MIQTAGLDWRLAEAVAELRQHIEAYHVQVRSSGPMLEVIVQKHEALILRIDRDHRRAHLYIGYGKERHHASYAIDNGERLFGLETERGSQITDWIQSHRKLLLEAWEAMADGGHDAVSEGRIH